MVARNSKIIIQLSEDKLQNCQNNHDEAYKIDNIPHNHIPFAWFITLTPKGRLSSKLFFLGLCKA